MLPATSEIVDAYGTAVPAIFGENLVFGFIFGSFAKGYAAPGHDIDMFLCVKHDDTEQREAFQAWYVALHDRLELSPDLQDPGEMTTMERLRWKIDFAERLLIRPRICSYFAYEAVVWTDALSDRKLGVIGDCNLVDRLERQCSKIMSTWRGQLFRLAHETKRDFPSDIHTTLLFEALVTYDKLGPNTLDSALEHDLHTAQ